MYAHRGKKSRFRIEITNSMKKVYEIINVYEEYFLTSKYDKFVEGLKLRKFLFQIIFETFSVDELVYFKPETITLTRSRYTTVLSAKLPEYRSVAL